MDCRAYRIAPRGLRCEMSSKRRKSKGRRYPINRIKQACSYDPAEIAKLLGVHRNTVRHWLKKGSRRLTLAVRCLFMAPLSRFSLRKGNGPGGKNAPPVNSFVSDAGHRASLGAIRPTCPFARTKSRISPPFAVSVKPSCTEPFAGQIFQRLLN
jgi:hypothetical protein